MFLWFGIEDSDSSGEMHMQLFFFLYVHFRMVSCYTVVCPRHTHKKVKMYTEENAILDHVFMLHNFYNNI